MEKDELKRMPQLDLILLSTAVVFLLFGALFIDGGLKPVEPKTYQEIVDQASGRRSPVMKDDYKNFYAFLRVYIFGISAYFISINYKNKDTNIKILFGLLIIGIIFNPIQPLSFNVGSLKVVDFLAGSFFAYYLFLIKYRYVHSANRNNLSIL